MSVKRVLQVVGSMDTGGMETLIMNWYRKIDKGKLQFDFMVNTQKKGFYEDEIVSMGGKVYHFSVLDDKNYIKYIKELKLFFKEHKEYQVIHGHHSSLGSIYLNEAKKAGIPCRISHSHIAMYSKTIRGYLKYFISRTYGKYANFNFACSNAAGNYMYGEKCNFKVINNGIDTEKFSFSQEKRDLKRKELNIDDKFVLVHVGRFFDQKNHTFLIDILSELRKINDNVVLLLVGTGPLEDMIKLKTKELKLGKYVKFMGVRTDVSDILSASDVFVFPSLYEGLPLTLVEAQASGLPVVCSNTITDETKLTDYYYTLSLDDDLAKWTSLILETAKLNICRDNASEFVRAKQYDCGDIAHIMQSFYLKHSKNLMEKGNDISWS